MNKYMLTVFFTYTEHVTVKVYISLNLLKKRGRDHVMVKTEWIVNKAKGLYDNTHKRIMLFVNKFRGVTPSYWKCHKAKEMSVDRIDCIHDSSFGILLAYGIKVAHVNSHDFHGEPISLIELL